MKTQTYLNIDDFKLGKSKNPKHLGDAEIKELHLPLHSNVIALSTEKSMAVGTPKKTGYLGYLTFKIDFRKETSAAYHLLNKSNRGSMIPKIIITTYQKEHEGLLKFMNTFITKTNFIIMKSQVNNTWEVAVEFDSIQKINLFPVIKPGGNTN